MSGIFAQPYPSDSLHFYAGQPYDARQPQPPYAGAMGSMGSMSGSMNMATGNILAGSGRWWEAFGTGGLDGEPSLMEELGINPSHILQKSLAVLNPASRVDSHIMDDADLAGPFVFCFAFAFFLLLVSCHPPLGSPPD
ncbi:hypothetical protein C352_04674 [Cryptococcus neoformans CHC193]|nr:hypothetical protein C353_04757 [Cryptococcus neoformans var. grubii AD1-83a]OXG57984.1 hypothetical protein C352_04674 [Cryptococcus neoformans var. grubii CHC193]